MNRIFWVYYPGPSSDTMKVPFLISSKPSLIEEWLMGLRIITEL